MRHWFKAVGVYQTVGESFSFSHLVESSRKAQLYNCDWIVCISSFISVQTDSAGRNSLLTEWSDDKEKTRVNKLMLSWWKTDVMFQVFTEHTHIQSAVRPGRECWGILLVTHLWLFCFSFVFVYFFSAEEDFWSLCTVRVMCMKLSEICLKAVTLFPSSFLLNGVLQLYLRIVSVGLCSQTFLNCYTA